LSGRDVGNRQVIDAVVAQIDQEAALCLFRNALDHGWHIPVFGHLF